MRVRGFWLSATRTRGTFGLGITLMWDMRVLSVRIGPWCLDVEGPQS